MGSTKDPAYKPQAPQETYNKNRALAPDQKFENMYLMISETVGA